MKNSVNSEQSGKSIMSKVMHFPLTKIIVALLVCIGVVMLVQEGAKLLFGLITIPNSYANLIISIVVATAVIACYILLFKYYEKRKITELSFKKLGRNLTLGFSLGFYLQLFTILVIFIFGEVHITAVNSLLFLIPAITMGINSAIFEEIIFRGVIYRIIEEKLGSYIALLISALIFGLIHLANPHSTLIGALGLAIQAGLLLGAAYIYSRNLWFPIAIHFAWNFTQSGLVGAATSGREIAHSLLSTSIEGAEMVTGGQFGPENSIQATLFCLIATIVLLVISHKQHKIITPSWMK